MPYYGGQPTQTTPQFLMERLMKGGLSREQAAALVGNLQKESSLITNNINEGEQAFGLMQWRGDRFKNLQNYAVQQGKQWTDPGVQADFALHEMRTTEANNAQRFLQATDLTSANDALHAVIRYRDRSEAAQRGQFAQQAYGQTQNVENKSQEGKPVEIQTQPPPVSRETLAYSMPRDEFAIPANAKGMRGGLTAIGAAIGQGLANPQGRQKLGSIFGTGAGQQIQQPPAGSPEMLSGFKGLFGGGSTPGQIPGAQSYIDPNTGSQMATGLPGRYEQGDVLNLGQAPPEQRFPGGRVPLPRARPLAAPGDATAYRDEHLDMGESVADARMGALVDPYMGFDYG